MNEYKDSLDWKTVFKKILNNQGQHNETCSFTEKSFQEEKLEESGPSLSLSETVTNCDNVAKDNGDQCVSFHELTLDEKPTSSEFFINSVQHTKSNKRTSSFSEGNKSNQIPEWNTVFKNILGKNSSPPALGNQKKQENLQICNTFANTRSTSRNFCKIPKSMKQENLQTCDAFVSTKSNSKNFYKKQKDVETCNTSVNTKSTQRKKFSKVPKSKDPEEEKVRELFARSRMFEVNHYNLNDFEGAGVDIFKSDKNPLVISSKLEFTDTAVQYEPDSKPFVPLQEIFAKYEPYTTADLIASPCVPFDEPPWDEDFFF